MSSLRACVLPGLVVLLLGGGAGSVAAQDERVMRALEFEGNAALDDEVLSMAISTTNSSGWATNPFVRWLGLGEKRYFDEVEFRRDVVRLVLLYRQSGYMNAVVDTIVRRTPRDAYITFRIHEGAPVRVERFDIRGVDSLVQTAELMRDLPLQVGDPFNRFLFLASADTVISWFKNRGYPYVEVLRNYDSDAGQLRAEIFLEVLPGPRMRVGQVAIQGLHDIDTSTVRRMLSVAPGNVYRERDFFQSQRDLYAMDVFRSVNVSLVDSLAPETSTDSTVRALVRLVEGPRHRIRLGAGYGSVDCFRTQASWGANDFLGGGRSLTLTGRLSKLGVGYPFDGGLEDNVCPALHGDENSDTLNYSVALTLAQPAFISPRHRATVGVFAERRSEVGAYTREAIGFNTGVIFNARRSVPVTLSWGYSLGRTIADDGVVCSVFRVCAEADRAFLKERRAFAAITLTAVRDRVNSPLDPTRGSVMTASLVHASRVVGSDPLYEFNRAELEIARYYPIGRSTVFAWRVRTGTALPQQITLSSTAAEYLPPDQRFYAGGPNSVRGYGRNELGSRVYVTDEPTNFHLEGTDTVYNRLVTAPTGGNSVFVMNAELRLASPVFRQRMRIGLFVDVGQVWERQDELLSFERMRVTPGVGLRFTTPLGPVRFDVAYNPYDLEEGPLYFQNEDGDLELQPNPYRLKAPTSFFGRLVYQFAVGQAF